MNIPDRAGRLYVHGRGTVTSPHTGGLPGYSRLKVKRLHRTATETDGRDTSNKAYNSHALTMTTTSHNTDALREYSRLKVDGLNRVSSDTTEWISQTKRAGLTFVTEVTVPSPSTGGLQGCNRLKVDKLHGASTETDKRMLHTRYTVHMHRRERALLTVRLRCRNTADSKSAG